MPYTVLPKVTYHKNFFPKHPGGCFLEHSEEYFNRLITDYHFVITFAKCNKLNKQDILQTWFLVIKQP